MRWIRGAGTAVAIIFSGAVLAGTDVGTLNVPGSSVSTTFITRNGRVFVPLADVAKAFHMSLAGSGASFTLAPAGGANQVNGLAGKVGQVLNCGYATLEVVGVTIGNHYDFQFTPGSISADSDKENIVAVHLRVKNASTTTMTIGYGGSENSALVDGNGHSYEWYTGPNHKDLPDGNQLLPGSAKDFALIFGVPKTETPTQLVYGVSFYQLNPKTLKQFRIDLKQ
jgi:hypothetical protein